MTAYDMNREGCMNLGPRHENSSFTGNNVLPVVAYKFVLQYIENWVALQYFQVLRCKVFAHTVVLEYYSRSKIVLEYSPITELHLLAITNIMLLCSRHCILNDRRAHSLRKMQIFFAIVDYSLFNLPEVIITVQNRCHSPGPKTLDVQLYPIVNNLFKLFLK